MDYTKHQKAVMKAAIDLLKKGATKVYILKHIFGFEIIVKGHNK